MHAICRRVAVGYIRGVGGPVRNALAAMALLVAALSNGRLQAEDHRRDPLPPRALVRIGTDDLRMSDRITAIAFSPDGRLIAAADANAPSPRVAIFDVRTGRRVKQLVPPEKPTGSVWCIAFSPDGTRLIWGEMSGEVALWDLKEERVLFRERLHSGQVCDVAFSPDGGLVVSAGGDAVRLRRAANPAEVVQDLTTRPGQAPAKVVEPRRGNVIIGSAEAFRCLAFTPDGTRLVGGTSHSAAIFVWRIEDGRLLLRIPDTHGKSGSGRSAHPRLNIATLTPDGRRIMSVGQTPERIERTKIQYGGRNVTMSEVKFWDIETGALIAEYRGDQDYGLGHGALLRDGGHVAVADCSRLRILDAATGRPERTIELPGASGNQPAFSPDGTLVAEPIGNAIALFEVATGRRLHHDASTPVWSVNSPAWSPSGDRIAVGHHDGFVRVWDATTGKLIWHTLLAPVISRSGWNASPAFVSFTRDGQFVVAAGRRDDPINYENGIVAVYEADSGKLVREVIQKEIRWAALAPDGRMIVVATSNGSYGDTHFVGVELGTGRTRWANPPEHQRDAFVPVAAMRFEAKPPYFAAAVQDGAVIRFNALTGHEQRRFLAEWRTPAQQKARRPAEPGMSEAAFSREGRTLVSLADEWIYVWDVETGAMRRKFRHPQGESYHLTLAPDGCTLATVDLRHNNKLVLDTIRLFDVETGEQVLALDAGDDRAGVMAFSPDGNRLFTGFGRGTGIIWDVRRGGRAPELTRSEESAGGGRNRSRVEGNKSIE